MMVSVVISRTTLVPAVSFSLSTLLRQPTTYLGPLLALTITETTSNHVLPLLTNSKEHINPRSNVIREMREEKKLPDKQFMHSIFFNNILLEKKKKTHFMYIIMNTMKSKEIQRRGIMYISVATL